MRRSLSKRAERSLVASESLEMESTMTDLGNDLAARTLFPAIRRTAALLLAVAGLALLGSCEERQAPGAGGAARPPGAAAGGGPLRLAVIPKGTTHVFWKSIEAGARKAGKELGVEIQWKGPLVEDDREGQRKVIESFVTSSVSGIVLAPLDERAMVEPVESAMAAGKPVVIIDSGLKGEDYVSFVATDNEKGGVLAAQRLIDLLGKKGRVLLLRYQIGSASTDLREKGFIETIKKEPGIELVPPALDQYAGATAGKAQEISEALLSRYPEIDGIFCPNESSTSGMLQALENGGRAGKLKFVGFDANEKLVQALRLGKLHGLVLQNPVRMGELGVRTLVDHLRGKKVERRVDTGVYLATLENMDGSEMRQLLSPDLGATAP
jgi:ribose transport system substrate-binding protein